MIKMVCDKCGAEDVVAKVTLLMRPGWNRKEYDLCQTCFDRLKEFITQDTGQIEKGGYEVD